MLAGIGLVWPASKLGLVIMTALAEWPGTHYFVAIIIATFTAIVFNYILSIFWIWRTRLAKR